MDMLRFHKFTVGSFWISEYGDPEKSSEFEYIFRFIRIIRIKELILCVDIHLYTIFDYLEVFNGLQLF